MLHLLETTVPMGLARSFTVCQPTDLHLVYADSRSGAYETELAAVREKNFPHAHQAKEEIQNYLQKNKPDLLLMSGDILDFPTESNLDALRAFLADIGCPYLYTPGNHDWTFPQGYQSDLHCKTYLPRLGEWMNGTPDFQMLEAGGIVFIAADNSRFDRVTPEQTEKLEAALLSCRARGIPAVVCLHVPICSAALAPAAKRRWKAPVMMGQVHADPATQRFCELTAAFAHAVIAGHVHFTNDGPLDSSTCMQYVTGDSATGTLRIFRFL